MPDAEMPHQTLIDDSHHHTTSPCKKPTPKHLRIHFLRRHATFFLIPVLLCLVFVLIPYRVKKGIYDDISGTPVFASYSLYSVQQLLYYVHAYFIWTLMFDYVIPGCPRVLVLSFALVFFAAEVVALLSFGIWKMWLNKLMFLICGGIETSVGFGLVIAYTIWVGIQGISRRSEWQSDENPNLSELKERFVEDGELEGDFVDTEDMFVEHKRRSSGSSQDALLTSVSTVPQYYSTASSVNVTGECYSAPKTYSSNTLHCSRTTCWSGFIASGFSYICLGDASFRPNGKETPHTKQSFGNMCGRVLGLIAFKVCVFAIWFYLQWFAGYFTHSPTWRKQILSMGFQVSRIVAGTMMDLAAALFLPQSEVFAVRHFHTLTVNFFFTLFYRNLFLEVSDWGTFSLLIFTNIVTQFFLYPVRLIKVVYVVIRAVRAFLLHLILVPCIAPKTYKRIMDRFTYDKHVNNVATSYYLRCISEFFTFFAFIIFLVVLRYSYNAVFYPSLGSALSDEFVKWLIIQLSILFAVEVLKTVLIDQLCQFLLRSQPKYERGILMRGYQQTIQNNATWFLYTVYFLHFLHDIYIATQALPSDYVWFFTVGQGVSGD